MDYSDFKFAKGEPQQRRRARARSRRESLDRRENAKAKRREEGRCRHCRKPGAHTHHLKGRRGPIEVLLAKWKVYLCVRCHEDIHGRLYVGKRLRVGIRTDADDPDGIVFARIEDQRDECSD